MGTTIIWLLPMEFTNRLITLRKAHGFTQQTLADAVPLHVNQIKRYESGTAQPTLETLVKLAKALHVTLDDLVFGDPQRGPAEDFRMQFEALNEFTPEEKRVAKELLDSLILKHTANRLATGTAG